MAFLSDNETVLVSDDITHLQAACYGSILFGKVQQLVGAVYTLLLMNKTTRAPLLIVTLF